MPYTYLQARLIQCMRSELVAVLDVNKANLSRTAVLALVMSKIKAEIDMLEEFCFSKYYIFSLLIKRV